MPLHKYGHMCSISCRHASCRLTFIVMLLQRHSAELKAAGTVLVIGGGAVGVELAGKLPHLSVYLYLSVCMSVCTCVCVSAVCLSICLSSCCCSFICLSACAHLSDMSVLYLAIWLSLLVVHI